MIHHPHLICSWICIQDHDSHTLFLCFLGILCLCRGLLGCWWRANYPVLFFQPGIAGAGWICERSLLGHTGAVWSLAGWQVKVASGSDDGRIRVWDVGTGAHDATLAGHSLGVRALVVHGDRLLSASRDGTIRAWAVGTWAGLRTAEAWGQGTRQWPGCLAVSGSKLVSI